MRSYDEYCAIAKSLDVVGDRWTLLIVRELALRGPSRYTDLRNGLPGIATNLLAERLRELERADVIAREDAPPPIATTLFHLTPRGQQLQPVLDGLFRWGMPLMAEQKPDDAVRSHWLAGALESMLVDRQPDAPPVTVELQTGDQPIVIEARDGAIQVNLGPTANAEATLTGPPRPIMGLLLGLLEPEPAKAAGVTYHGDISVLHRIQPPTTPTPAKRNSGGSLGVHRTSVAAFQARQPQSHGASGFIRRRTPGRSGTCSTCVTSISVAMPTSLLRGRRVRRQRALHGRPRGAECWPGVWRLQASEQQPSRRRSRCRYRTAPVARPTSSRRGCFAAVALVQVARPWRLPAPQKRYSPTRFGQGAKCAIAHRGAVATKEALVAALGPASGAPL